MMISDWQTMLALLIVAGAMALTARRVWRTWSYAQRRSDKAPGGCCGSCASGRSSAPGPRQVISPDELKRLDR